MANVSVRDRHVDGTATRHGSSGDLPVDRVDPDRHDGVHQLVAPQRSAEGEALEHPVVQLEQDLRGHRAASRSVTLDRDQDLRVVLRPDARRPAAARRGRNHADADDRAERPPAADLDIKEGR